MLNNSIDGNVMRQVNQVKPGTAPKSTADELSSNFMTLLITQLQNQDPLAPLENAELTSQLAQINTVNGIENLNKTMTGITGQLQASQQLQATALINRGVLIPGDKVLVGKGEATPFGIEMAGPADKAKITLVDSGGAVIREFNLENLSEGVESFTWDGKMSDGSVAPDGAYRVRIEASYKGEAQTASALNYAIVNGVSHTKEGPLLDLGGTYGRVPMTDVRQVI